jgi:hypothetical protein
MLPLKYLLVGLGIVLFGSSGALVSYDIYLSSQLRRLLRRRRRRDGATRAPARQELSADVDRALRPVRWGLAQPLRAVNSRHSSQSTVSEHPPYGGDGICHLDQAGAADGTETQRRQAAEWKGLATPTR